MCHIIMYIGVRRVSEVVVVNKPGVARAVLQSASLLIN